MENSEKIQLDGLIKKQALIQVYFGKLYLLESEKKTHNKKINMVKKRIGELVATQPVVGQLTLFDDIDAYLLEFNNKTKKEEGG